MEVNDYGRLVENEWQRIEKRFPNIRNGESSIMPNHLHGILITLGRFQVKAREKGDFSSGSRALASPLQANPSPGLVVGSLKSTTTRLINGLRRRPGQPVWQRNFYDHIIRDDEENERIAEYILNNPLNWEKDELFTN